MKYGIAFCHYEPHKQIVGDYELVEDASVAFSDKAERDAYAWFELERVFGTHDFDGYPAAPIVAFQQFKSENNNDTTEGGTVFELGLAIRHVVDYGCVDR